MTDWNQKIVADIKLELGGVNDKDLRFLRIDEYLRMIKRVDGFAPTCSECNQFRAEIEQQIKIIGTAVKHIGKERRSFDKHLNQLSGHMKKGHGFYPPYHYTYSYTFYYSVVAVGLSFLISLLFPSIDRWFFIVPAFVFGLIAGQLVGGKKDAKVRADNKLL